MINADGFHTSLPRTAIPSGGTIVVSLTGDTHGRRYDGGA